MIMLSNSFLLLFMFTHRLVTISTLAKEASLYSDHHEGTQIDQSAESLNRTHISINAHTHTLPSSPPPHQGSRNITERLGENVKAENG